MIRPAGGRPLGGLSAARGLAARGLAARRAYLVVLVTIDFSNIIFEHCPPVVELTLLWRP
jgi:hypothetical protein